MVFWLTGLKFFKLYIGKKAGFWLKFYSLSRSFKLIAMTPVNANSKLKLFKLINRSFYHSFEI